MPLLLSLKRWSGFGVQPAHGAVLEHAKAWTPNTNGSFDSFACFAVFARPSEQARCLFYYVNRKFFVLRHFLLPIGVKVESFCG